MEKNEMTLQGALLESSSYFKKRGLANPRLEAEVLLCFALDLEKAALYAHPHKKLGSREMEALRQLVKRRGEGVPAAYLTKRKEFMGLQFAVNPHVLIPRPETELLVEYIIKACRQLWPQRGEEGEKNLEILDLGTGSGAAAVSLACNLPGARVTATDISFQALATARHNASVNKVSDRLVFRQGDLFQALPAAQKFHVIACNPPYIPRAELAYLSPEVRCEPSQALNGGEDGLYYYRIIIREAKKHIKKPGLLALEIGCGQQEKVTGMCEAAGYWTHLSVKKDYAGIPRVLLAFHL